MQARMIYLLIERNKKCVVGSSVVNYSMIKILRTKYRRILTKREGSISL